MIYNRGEEKKEISLEIKTVVIDEFSNDDIGKELSQFLEMIEKGGISDEDIDLARILAENEENEDNVEEILLCTEATISTEDRGNIEISYKENEDDAQIASTSKIIFDPETPDLVVMTKEGAMSTVLSFESGKTHICQYQTPFMPIKVYVETKSVKNTLLKDGKLKLDYTLNLNDTDPQHFIITVKMKETEEDRIKDLLSD